MTRDGFRAITLVALTDLIDWAELYLRRTLPRQHLRLIDQKNRIVAQSWEEAQDYLVQVSYLDEFSTHLGVDLYLRAYSDLAQCVDIQALLWNLDPSVPVGKRPVPASPFIPGTQIKPFRLPFRILIKSGKVIHC